MILKVILLLFCARLDLYYGSRILVIFPFKMSSHWGVLERVAKSLAVKGHQVDVVSHFPLKENFPNYADVFELPNEGVSSTIDYDYVKSVFKNAIRPRQNLIGLEMCEYLQLPGVQALINNQRKNPTYDLLLTHYLYEHHCFTSVGHLLKIPVVGIVTTTLSNPENAIIGNPLPQGDGVTFWGRLMNVIRAYKEINFFNERSRDQQYYVNKYLGADLPHFTELEKSISLLLVNSHFSMNGIKPKVQSEVEIGGIHIKNNTAAVEMSLKKFLDDSKDGFVLFSFGSKVRLESFPGEILDKFFTAFRTISPIRILLRVVEPGSMSKNLPDNVYSHRWLPQQQILQHPNIRGFVTQGGAFSIQEAVFHAVPMICMPFFADQFDNCDTLVGKRLAIQLDFRTARQQDYDHAFTQLTSSPVYKKAVQKVSALFRDRPRSPSDEAVYWIEYVIRHGKDALRSPSADLKWWQSNNADVYAFITASLMLATFSTAYLIHLLVAAVFVKSSSLGKSARTDKKFE